MDKWDTGKNGNNGLGGVRKEIVGMRSWINGGYSCV
jgi:hypothetical protein